MEVEAYGGVDDGASHARFGPTRRNAPMFAPPGTSYVYVVYCMYHCLNVVTEPAGLPAAVLIRAVDPLEGVSRMREARQRWRLARHHAAPLARRNPRLDLPDNGLARGPGLVCIAFDVDRSDDGRDLCEPDASLRIEPRPEGTRDPEVVATPRIGVDYADLSSRSRPWRLFDARSAAVSGRRRRIEGA